MSQTSRAQRSNIFENYDYGNLVINRTRADIVRRSFNRVIKWLKLAGVTLRFYVTVLPWLNLFLAGIGIVIRSITAVLKPTLTPRERILYLGLLAILTAFSIEAFIVSGTFGLALMAITSAAIRTVIDALEAYSNWRQLRIDESALQRCLQALPPHITLAELASLQRTLLIKQALVTKLSANAGTIQLPLLQAVNTRYQQQLDVVHAAMRAKNKCDTSRLRLKLIVASMSFNAINTGLIAASLLLCIANPVVGLSLLIITECVEVIAISCLSYNVWKRTHPETINATLDKALPASKTFMSSYRQLESKLGQLNPPDNGAGLGCDINEEESVSTAHIDTLTACIDEQAVIRSVLAP